MPMLVIGIDPGTRKLGWGVVRRSGMRLVHVAHGVIRTDTEAPLSRRLVEIATQLEAILGEYRPSIGSVEGMFFDKNAQSAAKLGHARGVVLLSLERHGVTVREHTPARVKRTLAGSGRADKVQVARMVTTVLGLEVTPPLDASDALSLAIAELRLDPRFHALETERKKRAQKRVPEHLAARLAEARAKLHAK